MSKLAELLAKQAENAKQAEALEREIAQARRDERAGAVAQVKALMAEHGLSLQDLSARAPRGSGGSKKGSLSGTKVAVKYRNAATGDSWTGRGLKPKWLSAALASGKKLADFAV
jgi:DNA-binding protein H-NS